MYSCTIPVPDGGGGGGGGGAGAQYMLLRLYTVMVWGGLLEVRGGLGCFN